MTTTYTLDALQTLLDRDLFRAADVDNTGSADCISHLRIEWVPPPETDDDEPEYGDGGVPRVRVRDMAGVSECCDVTDAPEFLADWVEQMFGEDATPEILAVVERIRAADV